MLMRPASTLRITTMSTPHRAEFRCFERLRVRWAEVDLQRIVFNGHYLMYFDTAVAGYWRAMALPYADTMAALQGDLFVRKAVLEYMASAQYDDVLDVGMRCARIGNSSMGMVGAVFKGDRCLVHGELVYVFADPATQTSRPVPAALRRWLEAHEAGEAMTECRRGDWSTLGDAASGLRQAVFVQELGAAADTVADARDADAVHVVVFNRAGQALSCGRLAAAQDGVGQLGRVATLAALRGVGLARGVLDALLDAARQRGDSALQLSAAVSARGFYERAGFQATGALQSEGGIDHLVMRMTL
jgi:YbgC/YbaW family acyl-CoA thioester hydrolase